MSVCAPLLALYVVYVWIAWIRRGIQPVLVVAAAAISLVVLWDAWETWRLGTASPRIASFLGGIMMMVLTATLLRRMRKPVLTGLMLWLAFLIVGGVDRIIRLGALALPTMAALPTVPILLALETIAFANLLYIHQRRQDLFERSKETMGEVFD